MCSLGQPNGCGFVAWADTGGGASPSPSPGQSSIRFFRDPWPIAQSFARTSLAQFAQGRFSWLCGVGGLRRWRPAFLAARPSMTWVGECQSPHWHLIGASFVGHARGGSYVSGAGDAAHVAGCILAAARGCLSSVRCQGIDPSICRMRTERQIFGGRMTPAASVSTSTISHHRKPHAPSLPQATHAIATVAAVTPAHAAN